MEDHMETMGKLDAVVTKKDLTYFDKKIGGQEREIFNMKNRA